MRFRDQGIRQKDRRIAFVTKNWLGDILMQTPAIRVIRENFPDCELIGFTPKRCLAMLANNPDIDRLIPFHEKETNRGLFSQLRFILRTREERIDQVFLFHRSFSRAFLFTLAGVRQRIGYATKGRAWLLTQAVKEPVEPMHQMDYFLYLLSQCGLKVPSGLSPHFYLSSLDRKRAEEILVQHGVDRSNYIVIHPGANWAPKRWPAEQFVRLIEYLNECWDAQVVLSGGVQDLALAKTICDKVSSGSTQLKLGTPNFNFRSPQYRANNQNQVSRGTRVRPAVISGKTSLGELGAIFEQAKLVVSGDSGPMHIAAAVGAPLLALFLATDSALTGPRGSGPIVIIQKKDAVRTSPSASTFRNETVYVSEVDAKTVIRVIEQQHLAERQPLTRTFRQEETSSS